ncbi:alpha/beta hydrolase fold domain-containing protein [Candidatus Zixiibacteriota bacterium]
MKKTITSQLVSVVTLIMFLLPVSPASAQSDIQISPDIVYGHKDGMALTFDVFRPAEATNGAGVLFMVSGGWFSIWREPRELARSFAMLLDAGFTVFAVRHGSAPRYKVPEAVEDIRRAVRFIRLNSSDWSIDPERLGVYGGSAGGHLSLMLGCASDEGEGGAEDPVLRISDRVAAVVAWYPPVDLRSITGPNERFPALEFDPTLAPSISPLLHVSPDDPPTLLIHGDADELVPLRSSEVIHQAFLETGVISEKIVLEGAPHGFRGEYYQRAIAATVAWFGKYLLDR